MFPNYYVAQGPRVLSQGQQTTNGCEVTMTLLSLCTSRAKRPMDQEYFRYFWDRLAARSGINPTIMS